MLSEHILLCIVMVTLSSLRLAAAEDSLKTFEWETNCPPTYDFCGVLHFCTNGKQKYGYRQEGTNDCFSPGPTIRLTKGKRYFMVFENMAEEDIAVQTNIHTHGAHISGSGNADDIKRYVENGECIAYAWDIHKDHAEGTLYYHAHKHKFSQEQVGEGAFGLLIVEDVPSTLLPGSLSPAEKSNIRDWMRHEKSLFVAKVGLAWPQLWYGNGVQNAQLDFLNGAWYRLRIAVSDVNGVPESLEIVSTSDKNPCISFIVAYDGVFRSSVPDKVQKSTFEITGSSRIDLAIKCESDNPRNETVHVIKSHEKNNPVATFNIIPNQGQHVATPWTATGDAWKPKRPSYLRDLRASHVDNVYEIQMSNDGKTINGHSWNPNVPIETIKFNSVQEWNCTNTFMHPFHVHIYHMQIVTKGGCGSHFEEGEWYDTVASQSNCLVRFSTEDIGQMFVMHCHVLKHEDDGQMVWMNVEGDPNPQPTTNPPVAASARGTCGGIVESGDNEDHQLFLMVAMVSLVAISLTAFVGALYYRRRTNSKYEELTVHHY